MSPLEGRTTREAITLMVTATVCSVVLLAGGGIMLAALIYPEADLADSLSALGHVLALLVGVVLGYVARGDRAESRPPG